MVGSSPTPPVDLAENPVAPVLCESNQAIQSFNVVDTRGKGLRHDSIVVELRLLQILVHPLYRKCIPHRPL